VLDPAPGPTRAASDHARSIDPTQTPDEIATALLEIRGHDTAARLDAHSGGGRPRDAVAAGEDLLNSTLTNSLREMAVAVVREAHEKHPLREGLQMATLAEQLGVTQSVAETVIALEPQLQVVGPSVALVGRVAELDADQSALWAEIRARIGSDLATPTVQELDMDPELLHFVTRHGELVKISVDLVYLPEQLERIRTTIRSMPDGFTVAQFRDVSGLSRKYAVPLLEWADKEGLTVRRGDTRSVR
jgi:selenocysteine-specific elongation factor